MMLEIGQSITMQRLRFSARNGAWGIATQRILLLLFLSSLLLSDLVTCFSGGGCNKPILPLSPPTPLPEKTAALFLSHLGTCERSGCVSGWRFCFYSVESEDVMAGANVTFSLWRRVEGGERLEEISESRYGVVMKTLPKDQWLLCKEKELEDSCEASVEVAEEEEELMVGVLVHHPTSLYLLGDVEEGEVMMGGIEEGRSGVVSNMSLVYLPGKSLLVYPVFNSDACSVDNATTEEMCSGSTTSSPQISPSPTPTDRDKSLFEGMTQPELYLLAAVAGLSLIIFALFALLLTFLCFYCKKRKKYSKYGLPTTVLLNSHSPINNDEVLEEQFEMHVLDTASSAPSTSFSPTLNGHPQVGPALSTSDQKPHPKKSPPPIKPKPASRKKLLTNQPEPAPRKNKDHLKLGVAKPVNRASSLMRSYSEEAIRLGSVVKEKPMFPMPPSCSPRLQRRLSTGCLPTPCLDEDDYTIPSPLLHRLHIRPQPYLKPTITNNGADLDYYSYAYTHVFSGGFATLPCRNSKATFPPLPPATPTPNQPPGSTTSKSPFSPLSTSSFARSNDRGGEDDYDEIFVDKYWEEETARRLLQSNHTHSHASSSEHTAAQIHSSTSHASLLTEPVMRSMSIASDDGYVNSDEYPRPLNPASSQPHPQKEHYTPLKPRLRKVSSSYEVPRSSNTDVSSLPSNQPPPLSQYDRLTSDLSLTSTHS